MTNEERTAKLELALAAAREANKRLTPLRPGCPVHPHAWRDAQANIQRITALLDEVLKAAWEDGIWCPTCGQHKPEGS